MNKFKLILIIAFLYCYSFVQAQAPTWNVNPNAFQYSMTVTAVLDLNCQELTDPANQLGAFVGGTLRGTANSSTVINGRFQANMTVYSNVVNGEQVSFRFYDANSNTIYNSVDTLAFQDNAIYGSPALPLSIRNNHQPNFLALSSDSLRESQAVGTVIGILSTQDSDMGQTHTYSFASGSGDVDNADFTIVGDTLKSNVVANFSAKSTYSIRLAVTDNLGCSLEATFLIKVQNQNDAPTAINLSSNQVNENNNLGDVVSFLTAIDSDPNESFNYSLVNGIGDQDNTSFTVVNNELRASQVFDFETKSSYNIRLMVTDVAGNTFQQAFTVQVIDLNEAPTAIVLDSDSILENRPVNSLIANISTVDPDAAQSFSYSFEPISGNDNAQFNIVGTSLRTRASFDFETLSTYIIYIRTRDQGGLSHVQQFTIRVVDANDAPTDIQLSNNTIDETLPAGSFVGTLNGVDPDANSTFTYSFTTGVGNADNGNFMIANDTLYSNRPFSFNLKQSHNIRVQVADNQGATFSKAFTIQVNDINNVPTDLFLSNPIILENTARGSTVGTLTTQDPDQSDSHTYQLVAGTGDTDNSSFNVSGSNLLTDTTFNVNLQSSYSIRLRSTDAQGLSFEKEIALTITNSNDAPTDILISPDTLDENLPPNSLVGNLSSIDSDVNDVHSYSFVNLSTNDNASFSIVGSQLRTTTSFDFESKFNFVAQVQSSDGNGGVFAKQLIITIRDQNDAPTDILLSNNEADEKQITDQFVGTLSSIDQDLSDSFTYQLVGGQGATDNADFRISADSLYATGNFDVLVRSQLSIRVSTSDQGGQSFAKQFTINVQDVNDPPNAISISNASIPENTALNSAVGVFNTQDIDPNQTFTYQLVSGTGDADNGNFILSGNELRTNVLFDYNAQRTHNIRLRSTDQGGLSIEETFVVNITNSNDAPTNIVLTPSSFNENIPIGSTVSTISTIDADSTDSFSYSFVNQGTNDNASFIITGDELRTAATFDFETKNLFIIEVQTRDAAGATYSRQLTLSVLDTNDAPTGLSISSDTLLEKSPVGSFIANLSTQDVDATDNHTYSLVAGQGSADNALFRINGTLLEVDSVLAFNDGNRRNIRIRSTDQDGLFVESNFTIRIKNQNDAPEDITLSDTTANENAVAGTRIALISTLDQDRNDNFTYELVAGSGDDDNDAFMIMGNELQNMISFDFETQSAYNIRLRTTDSEGASLEKTFTIQLENGNEAPTIESQTFAVIENAAVGTVVGTILASDVDAGDSLSFRIVGSIIDFQLEASSGTLFTNRTFDYEVKDSYLLTVEVSDALGLKDTTEVEVIIDDQIEQTLPVASYFSPNGDGRNDTWTIENVELYSNYRLNIFSANGDLVYDKAANYSNDWDGTFAGEQLPEGIYYYYFEDNQNASNNYRGTITLKR